MLHTLLLAIVRVDWVGAFFLGYDRGAVYSFSENNTVVSTVAHSSMEAETKAIDELVKKLHHMQDFLQFIVGEMPIM